MGHHGNSFLSFGGVAPIGEVGGWVELGRTTLGSSNATIDVTSLSDKRYLMVLCNSTGVSVGANTGTQLNGDTGNNYARRGSNNGGTDSTDVNFPDMEAGATATEPYFQVGYLANLATQEKLLISHLVAGNTVGAATAPFRNESVGKHAQTTNPISSYQWITSAAATFDIGSECVVLGWDPADTHTDNFWEVLADVDLSTGEDDTLSSGTFTARKYLWVQCFLESSGTVQDGLRVGNGTVDTGSNYSYRFSTNGGADSTQTSATDIGDFSNISNNQFMNMFIINNASNEKLIQYWINEGKSGAASVPTRLEVVGKWANTANQINIIEWRNVAGAGNYGKDSFLKVWGSN